MKDTENTSQTKIRGFVFHIKSPTAQAFMLPFFQKQKKQNHHLSGIGPPFQSSTIRSRSEICLVTNRSGRRVISQNSLSFCLSSHLLSLIPLPNLSFASYLGSLACSSSLFISHSSPPPFPPSFINVALFHSINCAVISQQPHPAQTDHHSPCSPCISIFPDPQIKIKSAATHQ